jgi:uncharacterized membrane protein HdeD (DUF308 family)
MKPAFLVGVILIIVGIVALAYQGFTYTQQKTHELGPIKVTTEQEKTVPLPPIVGVVAVIGGVILVAVGSKK